MVHLKGGRALPACNVPQPCRIVTRAGRQCLSVGAKCNTGDNIRVSLEDTTFRITVRVAVRVICNVKGTVRLRVRDYGSSEDQRYAATYKHDQRVTTQSGLLE